MHIRSTQVLHLAKTPQKLAVGKLLPYACLILLAGCMTPPVERVQPNYWSRTLTQNALTSDHLSEPTSAYLTLRGWKSKTLRHSEPILQELRQELIQNPDRAGLTAFAEFAYFAGNKTKDPTEKMRLLMTAARAAYATVCDEQMGPMLDPLDPNLRFVADIYNYALSQLVDTLVKTGKTPRDENGFALLEGQLTVSRGHGMEEVFAFTKTLTAFSHKTTALDLHNRRRGLGVPIVAARPPTVLLQGQNLLHPPILQAGIAPFTLLVRFTEPWRETGGHLTATTELWDTLDTSHVDIAGRPMPLEADTSLALAMFYERGAQYRGFINMPRLLRGKAVEANRGLFLLSPYRSDKIPVVLIHGLMDSPLTWVPMLNALLSDPELNERYQFWLFFYPTMNPILQSASELRQSLLALHTDLETKGQAWNEMVLVGHSMGGLITRLLITPSGDAFKDLQQQVLTMSEGDPEFQAYLKSLTTFAPLPFVKEAVFLGAPHRGATMANRPSGAAGQGIMGRPAYIQNFLEAKEGREARLSKQANGIANLAPDSAFSLALGDSKWNPEIPAHSIIGDVWRAGSTNGSDTVVAYWSSHIDGAASELVVRADHLILHKQPPAIAEVRRILLEYLAQKKTALKTPDHTIP